MDDSFMDNNHNNGDNMVIINIKTTKTLDGLGRVAYCGNNYDYWHKIYSIIGKMDDYSILGKPSRLIVKHNRVVTVANYGHYAQKRIKEDKEFKQAMIELKEYDTLACWCAPKLCHCEAIIELMKGVSNDND